MDNKTFQAKLNGLIKSAKSQREKVQALLIAGIEQYGEGDANTNYLTQLINACIGVKSLPTVTLTDYIKAHCNVIWVKPKGEEGRFKKAEKGAPVQVTMPETTWYDWAGATHNKVKADLDPDKAVILLTNRLEKAIKEGKIDGDIGHAKQVLDNLRSIVEKDTKAA